MGEFLDDLFENVEHVLREEATKKLYIGCVLIELSSSLLILNLKYWFG